MTARLQVAARLRARLLGEVRVCGLRAPARARWTGQGWELDLEEPDDHGLVGGFAEAERALGAFDFARRLWAGRLSEVFGAVPMPTPGAAGPPLDLSDVDVFLRLLGLADAAATVVRRLDPAQRGPLEAFSAGMNAFIDAGRWRGRGPWKGVGSRPRLVGPADLVLVGGAEAIVDALRAPAAEELAPAEDLATVTEALAARIGLLQGASLRAVERPGQPRDAERLPATPALPWRSGLPSLQREEVLPGGDGHRVVHEGHWVRLSVRRPTVAVRGGAPRRPWLRTGPRGPLISDVLARAEAATPPVGAGCSWTPGGGPPGAAPSRGAGVDGPAALRVQPDPPPAPELRLVPLRDGA